MSRYRRPPFSLGTVRSGLAALQGAAFWVAVVLPLVYPPLVLSADRVPHASAVLTVLVGLHGVLLVVGHYHGADADAGSDIEVNAL